MSRHIHVHFKTRDSDLSSERNRLLDARKFWIQKLTHAKTPEQESRAEAEIDALEKELDRLDR